jgi:hypothetical protein
MDMHISDSGISNKLGRYDQFMEKQETITNLYTVVLEGTSMSLQYYMLQLILNDPNNTGKEEIESFVNFSSYAHSSEPVNATLRDPNAWETEELAYYNLNYSEGIKLAICLKRNGWDLSEMGNLIKEIQKIMIDVLKLNGICEGYSIEILRKIEVHTDENSIYQQIIERIRKLKP